MEKILKIIDYLIYFMVVFAMIWFFYGMYQFIDLVFIRG
jgi:hypothetical protein